MTNPSRKLLTITLLLFVSSVVLSLRAQTLQASLSHYSTDDGLKSNAIAQIRQDDYGYLWLATWNGLSRFDGYNFYNYQTGNGSHIPHLHNRVLDIVIDQSQNVWLHMYDERIFVVNRMTDKIVNPFDNVSGSEEYRAGSRMFLTSSGDILVYITDVGVYKMRYDNRTGDVDAQLITTAGLKVNCIAEGYHNDIWVGTPKGVHRVDLGNLSIEREGMFTDEDVSVIYSNGFNVWAGTNSGKIMLFSYGQEAQLLRQPTGDRLLSLYVDSRDLIWFCDSREGASYINPKTGVEKLFHQRVLVPEHDGRGGVFNETGGNLWVRMNKGGYGYYNRETDEVEYFHNDPVNPWNLSNTINASLELPEGVVFESTSRRGLDKLEILKNTITRTLPLPGAELALANEVRAMYYDTQRHLLLIGNKDNTLFLIGSDGSRTTVTHDSKGNPIGRIYGIDKDSKGNYWLSSKDFGLFKMTPTGSGYTLTNYCHDDSNQWTLNSNAAYITCEDKHGNIWVATYGGGVNVLTKNKQGQVVVLNPKNEMHKYPRNSYLKMRTLATDPEGNVWAGSTDGILVFNFYKGKLSIKKLQESEEQPDKILMSNDIVCLARDKDGNMWVGTHGGGLSHSVGRDSKGCWLFETFGSQDGLPSEEIKSITFDQSGNVWFATDHVLCSYDREKNIFTTFSSLDGVDETMCSEGAAITLPTGEILFGTLEGYYTVDRKKLTTDNGSLLKLRITDFFLNDELQSPRFTNTFDYYVPDAKSVTLPNHNNVFAFRFASMNYQLQHRVHYQYMLEGYDHEWKNADKSRMVSYSGIPTGRYRFKVKAFLLESPDKYDLRTIEVVVPPYFLLSSKAIWLYMFLATLLGLGLMFWRQDRLAKKHGVEVTTPLTEFRSQFKSIVERLTQRKARRSPPPVQEADAADNDVIEVTDEYEVI